jgi:hypothetical protein
MGIIIKLNLQSAVSALIIEMSQIYRFVFLSEAGDIVHWLNSCDYDGAKMMDFAWQMSGPLSGGLTGAVEAIICSDGYGAAPRYRIVCAGNYGAPESKPDDIMWATKRRDIEAVITAVKTIIPAEDAKTFLEKSPLDYTDADRELIRNCLDAWYIHNAQKNLYNMCDDLPKRRATPFAVSNGMYPYMVNHSKKQYVNKRKLCVAYRGARIHPLPLLTCETADYCEGDYRGINEDCVGIWARDIITAESDKPDDDYSELVVDFKEE